MPNRLYIQTYGCQMNEYDSSKMADVLAESLDILETDDSAEADILLLNTCSIREKAQEKVFSLLGRWRQQKESRPDTIIGVGGCVASQEGEAILKRAPFVDIVFGPQTLASSDRNDRRSPRGTHRCRRRQFPRNRKIRRDSGGDGVQLHGIRVGHGRLQQVLYLLRGALHPWRGDLRPLDDVIAEVAGLAALGVKEVNLLGQNVNAYRGPVHGGGVADLATLIHYVAAIDGIDAIRFTTSHPVEFTDALIDAYAMSRRSLTTCICRCKAVPTVFSR